jgi:hypothetical protein
VAKVTLIFAGLLVALGLAGYLGTGRLHPTALIPAWFGLAMGILGMLASSPHANRRKMFMHISVTIALLGCVGGAIEAVRGVVHSTTSGLDVDLIALASKLTMTGLLLVYVVMCVRSFIAARRSGKV